MFDGFKVRLNPCDGREPITCLLLEFSTAGARLQLPESVELPTDVQILIGGLSCNVRIVWREKTVIGTKLIDEHPTIGARVMAAVHSRRIK
jgi:hypothetical protein